MAKPLFGLAFGPHATAYLDRMSPSKIRAQIVKKAKTLILNHHPPGSLKLHNITSDTKEPIYRVRSGASLTLYHAFIKRISGIIGVKDNYLIDPDDAPEIVKIEERAINKAIETNNIDAVK
jgi:hypothetical protein